MAFNVSRALNASRRQKLFFLSRKAFPVNALGRFDRGAPSVSLRAGILTRKTSKKSFGDNKLGRHKLSKCR